MRREELRSYWETLEGEHLKTAMEFSLHNLSKYQLGQYILKIARGGERITDPRLEFDLDGIHFENPVIVGAGWDKKGWAADGLYGLGFAGEEAGSVLLHPQKGGPRPRLWYLRGVGRNAMGFNSDGSEGVKNHLDSQERKGVQGVNISRNKLSPEENAPEEFALVADMLYDYADYFVINFQSPNTPGLRESMMRLLRDSIIAVREVQKPKGAIKPMIVKTSIDMSEKDIEDAVQIILEEGANGIADTNTTNDNEMKAQYGWQGLPGGLSGDSERYRIRATERMKFIYKLTQDTDLIRMGVGAINGSESAIERIEAGANVVQVVTAVRQRKAKLAQNINRGILVRMERYGIKNVQDMVGVTA